MSDGHSFCAADCSAMKRKNGDNFFDLTEIEDDVEMKKMCKGITFPMFAGLSL
jgi:hypothetical protein